MIKRILIAIFGEYTEKELAWKKYCADHDSILLAEEKHHSLERYKQYLAAMKQGFKGGSQWTSWVYPNYKRLRKWEEDNELRT